MEIKPIGYVRDAVLQSLRESKASGMYRFETSHNEGLSPVYSQDEIARLQAELAAEKALADRLAVQLKISEAALSDIGDAEREDGDDLRWCEQRAAKAIPATRAELAAYRKARGL